MAHQRKIIREAVKAQLLNKTAAVARVYETRVVPWRPRDLPAIAVYTLSEEVDQEHDTAPRELKRVMQLAIEAADADADNLDDALDALAEEIEKAMHLDDTLGNTAAHSMLASTEIEVLEEGKTLIGVLRLTYNVTYYTDAPAAADVILDDFDKANVRYNQAGEQAAADEAVDTLVDIHE